MAQEQGHPRPGPRHLGLSCVGFTFSRKKSFQQFIVHATLALSVSAGTSPPASCAAGPSCCAHLQPYIKNFDIKDIEWNAPLYENYVPHPATPVLGPPASQHLSRSPLLVLPAFSSTPCAMVGCRATGSRRPAAAFAHRLLMRSCRGSTSIIAAAPFRSEHRQAHPLPFGTPTPHASYYHKRWHPARPLQSHWSVPLAQATHHSNAF